MVTLWVMHIGFASECLISEQFCFATSFTSIRVIITGEGKNGIRTRGRVTDILETAKVLFAESRFKDE